ncbi:PLP-dependent transferase [Laetiporus sulphureus 93-53]|uniref:PLP-dependent transferase n=1 Tax=Laetiporus sulphureus 93-53 TaxID=1314785 RepID=A0A165C6S0_9APHY|nr:PLP-dependent transferase [Laetiporus sulphureus 93-53]KZT02298.1 PLP-dependent transferase [Laetiporus sulphureus 93-53]
MAIKGVARFHKNIGKRIITTHTEHKCVLDSCWKPQEEEFDVTYLPVQKNGIVDLAELEKAIRPDTAPVSVMTVNNETGVIQPIKEIGALVRRHRDVHFHTQAVRSQRHRGVLRPQAASSTPLVGGMGEAERIAKQEMARDHAHVKELSERLIKSINAKVEHVVRNGETNGYSGCVNLSFAYVEGESLLMALQDTALSSRSTCISASLAPSYVLRALGAAEDMAHLSLRFGMGRFSTEAEVDYVIEKIIAIVQRLRDMSPLWEMVQDGIDISTIDWAQH